MNDSAAHFPAGAVRETDQRPATNHLGMWAFLATEILFFGGLFAPYAVYRYAYPEAFEEGARHLDFRIGTLNTGVLLASSLFMALADHAIKLDRRDALRRCLAVAWLLGALFLALKGHEYVVKYDEHLVPGVNFHVDGGHAPQVQLFIFLYFALTGLHALHMLAGLGLIAWLGWLDHRRRLTAEDHAPVEMVGLYWHFVDCVWVFLYPLLYLIPHR